MKYNRLIAMVENKSGGIYQIALTDAQQGYVIDLISQLHRGSVKIMSPKLPLELGTK